MPLLCTSLLALLLLPLSLSLSCDDYKPLEEVAGDYRTVIKTLLDLTSGNITVLLRNHSCQEPKNPLPSCALNNEDLLSTLHDLNCELKNTRLPKVARLARLVQDSIPRACPQKIKTADGKRKKKATRQKRNEQKKIRRRKKSCRAKVILSNMTQCYQIINTILEDLRLDCSSS